jgi:uncharacterized protein YkwD
MPTVSSRMLKMRSRLLLIATASAALLVPAAGASADTCAGGDLMPDATNSAQVADATLCLINEQRAAIGAVALSANDTLSNASTAYAADMVARSFFDHQTPDGVTLDTRLARVGYSYELAGENIAWGEGVLATPAQIVNAWMHSEGHRTNILDPDFRQVGLGIVPGTPRGTASSFAGATYVTDFGTPEAQPAPRSVSQSGTLDARATGTTRDPVAHYAVQRKHTRRAHRKHPARHARRHTRHRHASRVTVRRAWQTVS